MNDTECAFGQFCRFEPGTCGGTGSCINAPDVRHDTRDTHATRHDTHG